MPTNKRALILAGGGLKVAFQAGVLQVWLDEAGLRFDHVDGASGGCFNAAMVAQGMSGRQIAANWRAFDPAIDVNLDPQRLMLASSLFTLDQYRRVVFPKWGLDFPKIQASALSVVFNVFNFSKQRLEVLPQSRLTEDALCACVSLAMWFPPVTMNGDKYIDAVHVTDANVEDAIARGADELWVIWTVSQKGEWRDGFVSHYFQIIEAAANGRFRLACDRIEANNREIDAGRPGEFGRRITLKLLQAEVPLHYIINLSADRVAEVVNMGIEQARTWCQTQDIALQPLPDPGPAAGPPVQDAHLSFKEEMKGFVSAGESDYDRGYRDGRAAGTAASIELTVTIDGVDRFITSPRHEAAITGTVTCALVGGTRAIESGVFNLLVDLEDATHKAMYYRLFFRDATGAPKTLLGYKDVQDDEGNDQWSDTTTLFTRILNGHVPREQDGDASLVIAAGILRLSLPDLLRQLTTFRVEAPTAQARLAAVTRFGRLFLGKLWDVYAAGGVVPGVFF